MGAVVTAGSPRGEIVLFPDAAALARAGAEHFLRLSLLAHERGEPFAAVLTGGGSPRELYRLLGTPELAERVPWEAVHLFWGDERCVPPDHPRSNFGMARGALIGRVPIPAANVHRMRGELGAERAAREYEAELREWFGGFPRFDLVHLGVGDDGHIASLFPFDLPRLLERERLVLPSLNRELGEPRVTLTPPVINSAARVEFLLPDARKSSIARKLIEGPLDPLRVPAQMVRTNSGKVFWLLTLQAARNLRAQGGTTFA